MPVVLQILDLLRSRNRENIIPLLQQPRQRKLRNRAALLVRKAGKAARKLDVGLEIVALEARHGPGPRVRLVKGHVAVAKLGGEDAAAERRHGHDGDTELAADGEEIVAGGGLDVAGQHGVFGLDGGDGGDFAGAAEGRGRDGGEANVLDFALSVGFKC